MSDAVLARREPWSGSRSGGADSSSALDAAKPARHSGRATRARPTKRRHRRRRGLSWFALKDDGELVVVAAERRTAVRAAAAYTRWRTSADVGAAGDLRQSRLREGPVDADAAGR